jgi:hypothetical protein
VASRASASFSKEQKIRKVVTPTAGVAANNHHPPTRRGGLERGTGVCSTFRKMFAEASWHRCAIQLSFRRTGPVDKKIGQSASRSTRPHPKDVCEREGAGHFECAGTMGPKPGGSGKGSGLDLQNSCARISHAGARRSKNSGHKENRNRTTLDCQPSFISHILRPDQSVVCQAEYESFCNV